MLQQAASTPPVAIGIERYQTENCVDRDAWGGT